MGADLSALMVVKVLGVLLLGAAFFGWQWWSLRRDRESTRRAREAAADATKEAAP